MASFRYKQPKVEPQSLNTGESVNHLNLKIVIRCNMSVSWCVYVCMRVRVCECVDNKMMLNS